MHRARLIEFPPNIATKVNNAKGAKSCARFYLSVMLFKILARILSLIQNLDESTCHIKANTIPVKNTNTVSYTFVSQRGEVIQKHGGRAKKNTKQ